MRDIRKFKYWAHKVIPLVYDDSLSYYEFLCKVVAKLNEVIENEEAQNEKIEEIEKEFNEKVDNVTNELNEKYSEFTEKIEELFSSLEKGNKEAFETFKKQMQEQQNSFEDDITEKQANFKESLEASQKAFESALEKSQEAFENVVNNGQANFEKEMEEKFKNALGDLANELSEFEESVLQRLFSTYEIITSEIDAPFDDANTLPAFTIVFYGGQAKPKNLPDVPSPYTKCIIITFGDEKSGFQYFVPQDKYEIWVRQKWGNAWKAWGFVGALLLDETGDNAFRGMTQKAITEAINRAVESVKPISRIIYAGNTNVENADTLTEGITDIRATSSESNPVKSIENGLGFGLYYVIISDTGAFKIQMYFSKEISRPVFGVRTFSPDTNAWTNWISNENDIKVVQETGDSETDVMSQKIVSEMLGNTIMWRKHVTAENVKAPYDDVLTFPVNSVVCIDENVNIKNTPSSSLTTRCVLVYGSNSAKTIIFTYGAYYIYYRHIYGDTTGSWNRIFYNGMVSNTSGSSTESVMSQKATTDAINGVKLNVITNTTDYDLETAPANSMVVCNGIGKVLHDPTDSNLSLDYFQGYVFTSGNETYKQQIAFDANHTYIKQYINMSWTEWRMLVNSDDAEGNEKSITYVKETFGNGTSSIGFTGYSSVVSTFSNTMSYVYREAGERPIYGSFNVAWLLTYKSSGKETFYIPIKDDGTSIWLEIDFTNNNLSIVFENQVQSTLDLWYVPPIE